MHTGGPLRILPKAGADEQPQLLLVQGERLSLTVDALAATRKQVTDTGLAERPNPWVLAERLASDSPRSTALHAWGLPTGRA